MGGELLGEGIRVVLFGAETSRADAGDFLNAEEVVDGEDGRIDVAVDGTSLRPAKSIFEAVVI